MFRPTDLCTSSLLFFAMPLFAQDRIGTIERGAYICELPGEASGAAGRVQADEGFRIKSASRYSSPQGNGTYLRRRDHVTFTSGPRSGDRYVIVRPGHLQKIDNGEPSRLRCLRESR